MLKSLFGDLSSFAPRRASDGPDADFASTEILEELLDEERGSTQPPSEPASQDIFVTGSAVQAMRAHLSSTLRNLTSISDILQPGAGAPAAPSPERASNQAETLQP